MYWTEDRRRKERIVVFALGTVFAVGIFFYSLLIGGAILLSVLFAVAVMAVVLALHYLIWGRNWRRMAVARHRTPSPRNVGGINPPHYPTIGPAHRFPRRNGDRSGEE